MFTRTKMRLRSKRAGIGLKARTVRKLDEHAAIARNVQLGLFGRSALVHVTQALIERTSVGVVAVYVPSQHVATRLGTEVVPGGVGVPPRYPALAANQRVGVGIDRRAPHRAVAERFKHDIHGRIARAFECPRRDPIGVLAIDDGNTILILMPRRTVQPAVFGHVWAESRHR